MAPPTKPQPSPAADPPSVSQVAAGATAAVGAPAGGFALGGAAEASRYAATYASAAVAGAAGASAIAKGARAIIAAFRRFLRRRAGEDIAIFTTTIREAVAAGQLTGDDLSRLRAQEQDFERAFQEKALGRWEKLVPRLLEVSSPDERALALRQFQDREQRILTMRAQAMAERAQGAIERTVLKALSPRGAYWKLNPHVQEHTLDCLVMGEKFWPWEVLEKYHPPRHFGCPCTLYGLQEALARGLMTLDDIPQTAEAVRRATTQMAQAARMMEAWEADPLKVAAVQRLEEAGVLSVDVPGLAATRAVGEVEEYILPGGESVLEPGMRAQWWDGDQLVEGRVGRVVVHDDEDLGPYATFDARADDGRWHLHVLASHVEEAPAFNAMLHPRDRVGQFADVPTQVEPIRADRRGRLGAMTSKEVAKLLKKRGFRQTRQKGSHAVYEHPDGGRPVVLPMHSKSLPRGTMKHVFAVAGLTEAEVQEFLLDLQEWAEHLHPRDRLGRWADAPTLNEPKVGEVATRMAQTALAWLHHSGHDLSDSPGDEQVTKNWLKQLRGRVSTDKEARRLVNEAIAENDAIPLWRSIVSALMPDHVVVTKGEPTGKRVSRLDTDSVAHRVAGGTTVIPDGNVREVVEQGTKRPPEKVYGATSYGLAALLRHEYGHSVDDWLRMVAPETRRAIIRAVGDAGDLSVYAKGYLARGGDHEVIPELLALIVHPDYREEDFPTLAEAGRMLIDAATTGGVIQEAPDFDLLHPRNRLGRFRLVPRTSEEVLALRARAYEKRWGPVPPGGLAKAPTPVDDPELLDALEAAQVKNVEHLGPDVIDHFGELPVVLVEDLGTGFWGAVAQADGLYSAHALRDRFVYNGVAQPSFLDGKAKPHTGDAEKRITGSGGAHDLASVIRHEWWHYVENQLTYEQMREYRSLFPRVESGGIDGERIAWDVGANAGADQGETAAEVFSLVSDPDFKPGEWPDWVYASGQAMLNLIYEIQEGLR